MESGKPADWGTGTLKSRLRSMGAKQWGVVLLLGLLLAVASLPVSRKEEYPGEERLPEEETKSRRLEKELEELLSAAEGVGRVKVVLMTDEAKDAGGFYARDALKVTGVLVAAEGADQPVVVRNIQEAIHALFQVEPHKMKVMKLK